MQFANYLHCARLRSGRVQGDGMLKDVSCHARSKARVRAGFRTCEFASVGGPSDDSTCLAKRKPKGNLYAQSASKPRRSTCALRPSTETLKPRLCNVMPVNVCCLLLQMYFHAGSTVSNPTTSSPGCRALNIIEHGSGGEKPDSLMTP
eukprot:s4253_g3.t1